MHIFINMRYIVILFWQAAYADRVECPKLKLHRTRPFIKELDFEKLRVLEKYEMNNGKFGELKLRGLKVWRW